MNMIKLLKREKLSHASFDYYSTEFPLVLEGGIS